MRVLATDITPREKILDAAEALFARRGFAGVGLSEIAEAVNLGKSSLFHHFPTKAQLYAAVVERILSEIDEVLTRALAAGGSPVGGSIAGWIPSSICSARAPRMPACCCARAFEDDELTGSSDEGNARRPHHGASFTAPASAYRHDDRTAARRKQTHYAAERDRPDHLPLRLGRFRRRAPRPLRLRPAKVKRRKDEIKALLHHGLVVAGADQGE
jgi:AcrR family transcriptional regulator